MIERFSQFIGKVLVEEPQRKIDRSAFLYLDPVGNKNKFAQCGTCSLFLPGKQRCGIFGKNDKVIADASCGLYINGTPTDDQPITEWIDPQEAGYVVGSVRCENCYHFDSGKSKCLLFKDLNEKASDLFDLEVDVDPKGCCNGWQKKVSDQ